MTKKDYIEIAKILAVHWTQEKNKLVKEEIKIIIEELCCYFKKDNPRFDSDKFRKACRLN